MENSAPRLKESDSGISALDLRRYGDGWIMAGEIQQHSDRTVGNRRQILKSLHWFLQRAEFEYCGVMELRGFFLYLTKGHRERGGRWGNPKMTEPVSPRTVKDYHSTLRTLFRWIVEEGGLEKSPMDRIPVPIHRDDQIEPFTEQHILQLRAAAKRSRHCLRDEAIVSFLLDTGVRASELCGLTFRDVDLTAKRATVEGKGRKSRPVYFGRVTARALWTYLRSDGREPGDPLFESERGAPLTRSGLSQLIGRLGTDAKITGVRCSPHTFRHTAGITFLRNGGNQLSLMALLGHTNMQQTARYVRLAEADVERQHRQFSPSDAILGGKRR